MILVYGFRNYGCIDKSADQYAVTEFVHLFFLPIVPIESLWMEGEESRHAIRLHGRSVVAGYLRVWGPLVAIACVLAAEAWASATHVAIAIAAAAAALTAWTWTWHGLGRSARVRADFNQAAFGTRCEPRRLHADMRRRLRQSLNEAWDALATNRSPNDVAIHGATSPEETAIAYGILRIANDSDADRMLDDRPVASWTGDGPYRSAAAP